MLTFSHIFLASKQNPTKKKSSMARSEWKKTHSSEWWVWWMGSSEWWVRRRGAIGVVWVASSAIWCEWVRERWRDDLAGGATISLLSLLSFSVSLFTRCPEMARWSRWSVTGFDEGGFERLERCDCLAPMRSGCIIAPTRRSSCSLSLSLLFSKAGNHLKWKWKQKSFSTVLAIFYSQPGNAFQFDPIWSNNQTPTFPENHFQNQFEAKTNGALITFTSKCENKVHSLFPQNNNDECRRNWSTKLLISEFNVHRTIFSAVQRWFNLSNPYMNQHSVSDFSKVQTWTCSLGTEEKNHFRQRRNWCWQNDV